MEPLCKFSAQSPRLYPCSVSLQEGVKNWKDANVENLLHFILYLQRWKICSLGFQGLRPLPLRILQLCIHAFCPVDLLVVPYPSPLSLFFAAEDLWNAVKTPTAPQPQADHRRDCLHPKEVHPRQVAIDLCSSGCLKCSCFGLNILQTTPRPKRFGGIGDWEPQEQVEGGEKVLVFGVARTLVYVK